MSPENAMQDKFDAADAAERQEIRDDLAELEAIREYLWPNQTGLPNKHRNCLVAIKARERLLQKQITALKNSLEEEGVEVETEAPQKTDEYTDGPAL